MDGKEAPSAASAGDGEDEGDRQEEREAGGAEKSSRKWWIGLWGKRRLMQTRHVARPGREHAIILHLSIFEPPSQVKVG